MNNIRFVSYLTIMLILLQSFSAVANSLDFHATDPQHLQQEHQHSDDHVNGSVDDGKEDSIADHHNPADCHHCGHCNGTHIQWVGQHAKPNSVLALQTHQFHYLRAVINAPINQLLRPPKA